MTTMHFHEPFMNTMIVSKFGVNWSMHVDARASLQKVDRKKERKKERRKKKERTSVHRTHTQTF